MRDALYNQPKTIAKIGNPTLSAIENISDDLQGEGVKFIIPSNIIGIYTRLEILLGLRLSGHTNTLTEASNLIDELYKRGEIQNKQQYRNALDKFYTKKRKLLGEMLEQMAHNTRPKIEEQVLIGMDKSTHEEHLSQSLQTNIKRFIIAITFLTGYNGIFIVTCSDNIFYFKKTNTDGDDFTQITIPPGAYEIESLNNEIRSIFLMKNNSPNQNIRFNSNHFFQH